MDEQSARSPDLIKVLTNKRKSFCVPLRSQLEVGAVHIVGIPRDAGASVKAGGQTLNPKLHQPQHQKSNQNYHYHYHRTIRPLAHLGVAPLRAEDGERGGLGGLGGRVSLHGVRGEVESSQGRRLGSARVACKHLRGQRALHHHSGLGVAGACVGMLQGFTLCHTVFCANCLRADAANLSISTPLRRVESIHSLGRGWVN